MTHRSAIAHALRSRFMATLAAIAVVGSGVALAAPDTPPGTLKKVKDGGVLVVGFRDASIPFSYYDTNQQPIGYSMDITDRKSVV